MTTDVSTEDLKPETLRNLLEAATIDPMSILGQWVELRIQFKLTTPQGNAIVSGATLEKK